MTRDLRTRVVTAFRDRFGVAPSFVARAPGRVNLIGDHTDYNEGFVLPMAIDRAVWIAARARTDDTLSMYSLDFEEEAQFELHDGATRGNGWQEYLRGMTWALSTSGRTTKGLEGVCGGDVPVGAGLSSSAALELATARACAAVSGFAWEPTSMARLAQRAENEWVGVNCGIMDQLIAATGAAGHAQLIDCRSLETRAVPIPPTVSVVVLDTATRRGLVGTEYNERRAQCEAAARAFGVRALRDVDVTTFDSLAARLDASTFRRARHVITENARTLAAAEALEQGDVARVGALMDESHASLRDDFQVSRPELDAMVELAREHPECHGARMTGAGFGGCAVALVDAARAHAFARRVAEQYEAATTLHPAVYVCAASDGASLE
jgi:galactokinase